MGSTSQLRYGKVVGDVFGVDPMFGAMLNPTGGLVGPDNKALDGDSTALGYHGVVHDAAGYLYNCRMDVAELDEVEFAYLLATLHSRGLIGVDSPGLFPSGKKACDEVYGAGFEHLQAHGWLKPLPQAGQYDLSSELVELAAVVADPEFVIFTLALQPSGYQRRFLHYLAGDSVVELSSTLGTYRLLALPSRDVLFQRVADMLGVFGEPAADGAPAPFIIEEQPFVQIRSLARSGAVDQAAAQLAVYGATGPAGAALAGALAKPDGGSMVVVLRASDGNTVLAGRKASFYGQQDRVWLAQRLDATTTRLQVQVVEAETLAVILREYLDFLKKV